MKGDPICFHCMGKSNSGILLNIYVLKQERNTGLEQNFYVKEWKWIWAEIIIIIKKWSINIFVMKQLSIVE